MYLLSETRDKLKKDLRNYNKDLLLRRRSAATGEHKTSYPTATAFPGPHSQEVKNVQNKDLGVTGQSQTA